MSNIHKPRQAVAHDLVLYHVLHPTQPDKDEWTQQYTRAVGYLMQFARDYGIAHLHIETYHTGQYNAECLMRTDRTAAYAADAVLAQRLRRPA
jgi:hypothetical protein